MTALCETHNHLASELCAQDDLSVYSNEMETFGSRLTAAREKAGFKSPADAIKRHGFTSVYYQHEAKDEAPRPDSVRKYAEAFGVDPAWLTSGVASSAQEPSAAIKDAVDINELAEGIHLIAYRLYSKYEDDPSLGEFGNVRRGNPGAPEREAALQVARLIQMYLDGEPSYGPIFWLRGVHDSEDAQSTKNRESR